MYHNYDISHTGYRQIYNKRAPFIHWLCQCVLGKPCLIISIIILYNNKIEAFMTVLL
jgi:hypothetical protein